MLNHHAYEPCPICQGEDYTWGTVNARGSGVQMVFHFQRLPLGSMRGFLGRAIGRTFVESDLRTRRCNTCGNIQTFAVREDAAKKKKLR